MQLILTHENADFDAVASQLAAHKLYPNSVPLLPRRINRNVEQFLTLYWGRLPFTRTEDWRKKRIYELVLVDTQTPLSVRGVVRHPQVTVIDHHTDHARKDGWEYQVEAVGATTTLLVERLQSRGGVLSVEEATLMLLGIYEDTGSLTYDTANARDAYAAGWLLEQGAQLNVVRRFLNIPLTAEQHALYEQLQDRGEWLAAHGRQIMVATAVAPENFSDEISSIVHRLRDALLPQALIVLVQIGRDVQLVARSTGSAVDVSQIARALGGGGHSRAAAALIPRQDLEQVYRRVVDLLPQAVTPMDKVAQIMSYGVQTVAAEMPVAEAAGLMQRFGYEGYPVTDQQTGQLVGLLTRRAVDRAMNHDLQRFPVSRVMRAGAVTVTPDDSVERVQQLMLEEGWGQIPVVRPAAADAPHGPLIGIVTRTDLLNYLFNPAAETAESDMEERLETALEPCTWAMVLAVSEAAADLTMPLYFVGGLVRDVLLRQNAKDLDMVVEGDAILLVRRLQERFGGEVHTHRRFGTAKWFTTPEIWQAVCHAYDRGDPAQPDHLPASIDFVTARTEFYREPSALPEVAHGSIKLDLHRRDFTINTLAVRLDGAHLGELLDFYGGQRDLEQGLIRVLHSLSFVDDPTRMLRAVRLEQRLGFQIEARTEELLVDALPMLDRVTGDRIRHEIELALRETEPAATMARLDALHILARIHPELRWLPQTAVSYARVPRILTDDEWLAALGGESPAFVYFALWLTPLPQPAQAAAMRRLRVRKSTRQDMRAVNELQKVVSDLPANAAPGLVEKRLRPFRPRVLLVARVRLGTGPKAALLEDYYHKWRHVQTAVNGNDLLEMGLTPGPQFAVWLDELLAARLDGRVSNRAEELALLRELVESPPDD